MRKSIRLADRAERIGTIPTAVGEAAGTTSIAEETAAVRTAVGTVAGTTAGTVVEAEAGTKAPEATGRTEARHGTDLADRPEVI